MSRFFVEHKWCRRIVVMILSYLCVLSLARVISLNGSPYVYWGGEYFGYNIMAVIIFGATCRMLSRFLQRAGKRKGIAASVGGILLSVAIVYGAYAHYINDIFLSAEETILQIFMILAISALTTPSVGEVFGALDRASLWFGRSAESSGGWKEKVPVLGTIQAVIRKRNWIYFLIIWFLLFVSYLPMFLANWPGNFIYDAQYQIAEVIWNAYSPHHPLIHTLLMGWAYTMGVNAGSASWGFQFYTLIQMLFLTASFAFLLHYLYTKRVRCSFRVCTFLWFALFPMHTLFSITATKDVLCAAFFLFFMVFLVKYLLDRETFGWPSYVGLFFSGLLLALFRNNALYAVIFAGLILALFSRGMKRKIITGVLFLGIFLSARLINAGLADYTNAKPSDSYKESLSVPLQGMARVASYRGEEMDSAHYDELIMYVRESDIPDYSPYNSDAIKNYANEEYLRLNTLNFFKLWVKIGLQFPDEYIESFVTNTMGYWFPLNQGQYVSMDLAIYHTLIGDGEEIVKQCYCRWAEKLYEPLWDLSYRNMPLLGYAFRTVIYVWLVIFYMLWGVYKKDKKGLMLGALPLAYLGTCLLGPIVALRYVYCLVVCAPLLICLMLSAGERVGNKEV